MFFISPYITLKQHIEAQSSNLQIYLATLLTFIEKKIEISDKAKACILAAAWCRHDHSLVDGVLTYRKLFSLPEILKAVNMLDSGRQIRVLERKLKQIEQTKTKPSTKRIGKIKNKIDNLNKIKAPVGSFTGAMAQHIRRWTRTLTKEELEFFALHLPKQPWKNLADRVHFNPSEDFPALPWFLNFCFGEPAPEDTMVAHCQNLNNSNVDQVLVEWAIPYSHLKQFKFHLSNESKARVAAKEESLDTVLWNYEDLQCPEVDEVVNTRLKSGEKLSLSYGKLMERLILLRTQMEQKKSEDISDESRSKTKKISMYENLVEAAGNQLKSMNLQLDSPVVVLGDASSSMDIAIQTATILSSLLTTACSAELNFFNSESFPPDFIPKSVDDVLTLALGTEAHGRTSNAVGLLPYYNEKKIVKTFIMATDEEENVPVQLADGSKHMFASLFMKYREEVYPAKLVLLSFLKNQHDLGQIYEQLVDAEVPDVIQFKFNGERPDLKKIDHMLGILSSIADDTSEE